jgi:glycosyltransferase involved in cell wall biosynthesis
MRAEDKAARMRVLMTTDAIGGVWSYSLDLSRLLCERGVEIVLAVMGPAPDSAQMAEAESIPNLELRHRPFDLEWFQNVPAAEIARSADWLRDIAEQRDVDLVHLNGYAHAAARWQIPVVVVAHSCVYSWWRSVHGTAPPAEYRIYRQRVATGLRAASAVVAPSRWLLETVRSLYRLPLAESEVIPNFTLATTKPVAKEALVMASGRFWDTAKNLWLLDAIAPEVEWPVYVAGTLEGPEGTLGTPKNVRAIGQLSRSEMAEWLSKSAIFAHPARYEPFGLAVLEAAMSGCALVLSDIPPLRELWEGCAVFAGIDEPGQWIEQLNRMIANPGDRAELAAKAQSRAAEFVPEVTAVRYLGLYRRLTAGREVCGGETTKIHEHPHQTVLP